MSAIPTSEELSQARLWFDTFLSEEAVQHKVLPLTFAYGETPFTELMAGWQLTASVEPGDKQVRRELLLVDPENGLEIRLQATLYQDYPAVEWVAYLKNVGQKDTAILDDILPLNVTLAASTESSCCLHYARGSVCREHDFEPLQEELRPGGVFELASRAGRSSDPWLPFFNLQLDQTGVVCAVGWTGGWKAVLSRSEDGVRLQAGMAKTHLKLHPGEEIRTPRMLLLFWQGERRHGQNLLRQFLLAHHTPRPEGEQLLQGPICWGNWGEVRVADQLAKLAWWREQGMPLDVFWIDAGWYGDAPFLEGSTVYNSQWYRQTGNWRPNREAYPEGLGPIGEACRKAGYDFLVWIEPERPFKDTDLPRQHPEWLLGPRGDSYLVNLGLPEARKWITDLISGLITESGITFYRQDFNTDPAFFWEQADAPDRVGMTEIGHIMGLYAFWDELLVRHPGLKIDNCSSGGRRLDLEMISRSIALWRSDYQCIIDFDPIGMQGQTWGLSEWVPLSAGVMEKPNTLYSMRSGLGPALVLGSFEGGAFKPEAMEAMPLDLLRQVLEEERSLQPYFYGDYYPLLTYTPARDAWAAWQFDRPDAGEGMIQAFRRQESPFPRMEVRAQGLDPEATYEVRDVDTGQVWSVSGGELMASGIEVEIAERPASKLLVYRRV
ncbi:MAG: hypothetical protein GX100_08400 [candidate division WS1 bacterium]|nr:hypothetical protein [candidate division WS1 bacterium]